MPLPEQPRDATDFMRNTTADVRDLRRVMTSGVGPQAALGGEVPMYPVQLVDLVGTTSTAYVALWRGRALRTWPSLSVSGVYSASVGTTGDLRLMINGVQMGSVVAIASGSSGSWSFPAVAWPTPAPVDVVVEVQARTLTGVGSVYVGLESVRASF